MHGREFYAHYLFKPVHPGLESLCHRQRQRRILDEPDRRRHEPYLRANGIRYRRNDPDTSAAAAIREANSGYYDFYLALHSNAIGNGEPQNTARGIIAFYYPTSTGGQRGAELIAENLREIYPLPNRVSTQATTTLGEVADPGSRRFS